MSEQSDVAWAKATFHHEFANTDLLAQALTHSTYANEQKNPTDNNERLEFLGDAVLELLVSHQLFQQVPNAREGVLSKERSFLVRRESLAAVARQLQIHKHLLLGEGQRSLGGEVNDRLMANGLEAVMGAVFQDGGYDAALRSFAVVAEHMQALSTESVEDYKGQLQELCHRLERAAPQYAVAKVEGPDHERIYHCTVHLDEQLLGQGHASSRKAAEQICARQALEALQQQRQTTD